MTYCQNALDKIVGLIGTEFSPLAKEMRIFEDLEAGQSLTDDVHLAHGFTAWGLFNLMPYVELCSRVDVKLTRGQPAQLLLSKEFFRRDPAKAPLPGPKTVCKVWLS